MFRKVMNKSLRDPNGLKHEIFKDSMAQVSKCCILTLVHLFKVSFGIWLLNVSLSTELLSVSVSWGNGAYAISSYVFMSVCLCPFAVIFDPFGQNQAKFVRKRDNSPTITFLCILWKEAPRKKREAVGVSHLWEKESLYSRTIRLQRSHTAETSQTADCRKTTSAGVCSQPPDTNLREKQLYWCSAHKNTATLGTHSPLALKFSSFYFFLFLSSSTLSFLSSQPTPIFLLNLVLVIKAKRVKTKVSVFTLPP